MERGRSWIIRYPDFTFSRPISEERLLKMFSEGVMKPQDEICHATGYWFSLQDVKEMRKHFGNIPLDGLFKKVTEEVTRERYAITAPIALRNQAKKVVEEEESIRTASPLTKLILTVLTVLVVILLFVWFG